jgi:hydroxymethylpyrimidine pyrophosphatase-like HAD family hydrolase
MNKHLKVAFDIDDTLIKQDDQGRTIPNHKVIDLFRGFQDIGCDMIIWSGGGQDYAEQWRDKLGLQATVLRKGSIQVDIAVDDQPAALGLVTIKI